MTDTMRRSATLSEDGVYRYELTRTWADDGPLAVFVMLNPSTADGEQDDPTIRRCVGFAQGWGMGGLVVVNLYAYRATDPADLRAAGRPVGPLNDAYIEAAVQVAAGPVCVAWGATADPARASDVLDLIPDPVCMGYTKGGQPRHPLYLPTIIKPAPYRRPGA